MSWYVPGPSFSAGRETLRGVTIITQTDRPRSATDGHRVRVMLRDGEFRSVLGEWDQADDKLKEGRTRPILSARNRNKLLRAGFSLEVEVTETGSPASILGTAVEFTFDGTRGGALISSEAGIPGLERAVTQMNKLALTKRSEVVQLTEEPA